MKTGFGQIDFKFYKRLFLFSIPLIVLFLYVSNSISINIHLFIGVVLILLSLKENIVYIEVRFSPILHINSGMTPGMSIKAVNKGLKNIHPIGRSGEPKDVANLICWLVSEEASFVTGQVWTIDGGRMIKLSLPNH